MSPLDDELRAALHGRAQVLAPSPDPLAGIERRARRIQRHRLGAAVAGSTLAVAAIAAAVPAVQSATSSAPDAPRVAASTQPSTAPARTGSYALDPDDPWDYRGTPQEQLGDGTLATIEREYTLRHPNALVTVTPLWGQVWEPSGQPEVVFLATVDGSARWGVARGGEAGPDFPVDEELTDGRTSLPVALPGDETARLLVVAAPGVGAIEYAEDDTGAYRALEPIADGVATGPLDAPSGSDVYRVLAADGGEIELAAAPDPPGDGAPGTAGPATALDPWAPWEVRGDRSLVTDGQLDALGKDWASRNGIEAEVETVPLFVQRYEADAGIEVVYLVRSGDGPWTWGVAALGEGGWAVYAEHEITEPLLALAAALPGEDGGERLLVVGAPSLGGAVYAAEGSQFAPMTDLAAGVFVTSIRPDDEDDRFKVVDGDGNLDDPLFEGPAPDFQNAG